jgi:hypothetical protein
MAERTLTACLLTAAAMLIAAASVAPPTQAQSKTQAPPQTRTLAITGVNVVDVIDGRIVPNATVTISGTAITSVTPNGTAPANARVVDGQGKFLIPGLWDMHAHMEASGEPWLQLYVANGVTGIRDMGSQVDVILKMREDTASGRVIGPRIFAAGPILDDAPADWPFRMRVKTADDGRAAVRLLKGRGVDLIKVHNFTPRDVYFAIADEARRQNLPLAGHVPLKITTDEAVEAGQKGIEHLSESQLWMRCSGGDKYQPEACRPMWEMLARRGIWQTPTLLAMSEISTIGTPASSIPADQLAYATKRIRNMWGVIQAMFTSPGMIRVFKQRAEAAVAVTNDMAKAGVGILTGCDSMVAGFCVHDEVAIMVRGGMTPLAALQAATLNPARYFGISDTAGSVASGRRADLVLLDANPLADIANVRRIRGVVAAGRFLDRKELDTLLTQAKTAASR